VYICTSHQFLSSVCVAVFEATQSAKFSPVRWLLRSDYISFILQKIVHTNERLLTCRVTTFLAPVISLFEDKSSNFFQAFKMSFRALTPYPLSRMCSSISNYILNSTNSAVETKFSRNSATCIFTLNFISICFVNISELI